MADVITRFKLETNQFDSALRNASNSLVNITKQLSLAGKDFDKFAQEDIEVARSLGQVESGANNLKDKLRDLVSAYNNVARAYNNLTKDQQQGDFGKAMAASLDQLQTRITQTKNELYGMSDSTKQAGTGLGSLNDIFGISITKLAGWGAAIAAAKGALDVAKDAFFASEQNIDSWGQAVEAGQAVYESFLTSINSGDISGFLSRIGQITNAAIEAYNALDQLNTQKTIQSPQVAKLQSEITRMRTILQTGRFVESADGRREISGLKTGDVLSKEQLNNVSKRLEKAMNELAGITSSQVNTATKAIDKLYAEQAAVLGVSKNKFQQATSSWKNFQAAMDNANEYERWKKKNTTYTTQTTSTGGVIRTPNYDDSKNPYRDWAWVSRFKDDGERFQRLIQEIQNRESAKSTLYSQYGQAYRRINRAEGVNPYGSSGSGKAAADKTETELKQNEAAIVKLTEKYQKLATDAKTANDAQLSGIKERQAAIQTEIANLKTRNEELKKFAAEAQGIQVNIGINSSLPDLTAKLKELQAAQSQALNGTERQEYQKQIEQVNLQIDAMKGKWKDGMKATISVNTEAIQKAIGESSKLQDLITKPKKQTSSATVESNANHVASDASKLEDIVTKPKKGTATIDSNIKEVAADASNLEDVITKPKNGKVTITADTSEAKSKIGEVDAMVGDKTAKVTFTADNAEVLQKAAQIEGVQIDPKTLTVTALTAEAENALSNIEGFRLSGKTADVTINSNIQQVEAEASKLEDVITKPKKGTATIDSNIQQVEADTSKLEDVITKPKKGKVTIESNTEQVAADASKLEDVVTKPKKGTATIDSNIKEVAADASNLEDIVTRPKKGTANIDSNIKEVAADASKLEDVITKPKTGKVTITADTSDAKSKIGEVDAMVGDKTAKVTFSADNAEVLQKAAQIEGVQIDPKTLTVTANTAEAEDALSNIEGLTLQPKELDITADVQKVLDVITQIDGVTVDPKTMEITAGTAEAYAKLQELFKDIEGSTVQFEVVPNLGKLSNNNITAIISDIKKKIDDAEIGSDLYNNLTERLADATAIGNLIKIAIQNGLDTTQFDFTDFWANIIKGEDIPDTQLQSIVDRINNYLQEKHIELNMEVGTVTEKNDKESEGENKNGKSKNSKWKKSQTDDEGNPYAVYGLGKMSNGMSSLVSSVEQLGIELPQGIKDIFGGIQAVTSILTSIMTIVEAIEMLSSATSFMPFFAQGGIIPHAAGGAFIGGSHFSGDVTPVLANAGELILNKASQGNLVSQLQTNETNTGNVAQPFITGEQIYLGLNNYLRRIGKGELLTARR